MNISLLDSATVPHGAAFWARTTAEQLARRGHRVTLLVPPRSPLREPPPGHGAKLRLVPLWSNFDLASVAGLWSHLRQEGVDVFLFQGSRGIRLGALAALLAGVPGVARVGIGGGLKATAYDRWLCRRALAHFIANANSIERELAALPWVGPKRVTRIYNGIDLEKIRRSGVQASRGSSEVSVPEGRYEDSPALQRGGMGSHSPQVPSGTEPALAESSSGAPLRREHGIPHDAPVIVVVARLQAHKGHEDLLRCLPELWRRYPALRVLVAGQGPHEAHLRAVAREVNAGDHLLFLGHCADVRPVLEAADLFVLPSHREGLPNAVLEAMAMGVPVVAAAADGTGEVVLDGETGLLATPGDVPALGTAVARLLDDTALRERLADAARRRIEEQFSLPRAVEQVEALLEQVAGTGRATVLTGRL